MEQEKKGIDPGCHHVLNDLQLSFSLGRLLPWADRSWKQLLLLAATIFAFVIAAVPQRQLL